MKNNLRLEGKTAVITGAASGIGKEIALLFFQQGAKLALIDKDEDKINEVKKEVAAESYCIDISEENEVKSAFSEIEAAFGKIDILINCAGIFDFGTVTESSYALWKKIHSVNLDGAFLCSKYAVISMLHAGTGGSIVNVSSEAGLVAMAGYTAYCVSKAALIQLSKCMAIDYALDNIRVNCVCPGRVLTPLVQAVIDNSEDPEKALLESGNDRPLMRMGTPSDIAHACLGFADDNMTYATGSVLSVDGGYTAR